MKNFYQIFLMIFLLSGCYSVETNIVYNKSLTQGKSSSQPIFLTFADNKKSPFHFILKHAVASDNYHLYVRWASPTKELLFDGTNSTLKFLVNKSEIITLLPVKMPKIVAYNIENKSHMEETIFNLSAEQIRSLAYAKTVEVELTGRYIVVEARFNRLNTFKAFRNFVEEG